MEQKKMCKFLGGIFELNVHWCEYKSSKLPFKDCEHCPNYAPVEDAIVSVAPTENE